MYLRIIYNEKKTLKEKNLKKEQFFCDLFFSFLERERGGRVGTGRKEEGREEGRLGLSDMEHPFGAVSCLSPPASSQSSLWHWTNYLKFSQLYLIFITKWR